jgi:uncharacterized membrane protein YqaE (UPF0057 family)
VYIGDLLKINKPMKKILLLVSGIALMFSSCMVEKRQHMSGYHVEWFGKKEVNTENKEAEKAPLVQQVSTSAPTSEVAEAETATLLEPVNAQPIVESVANANQSIQKKATKRAERVLRAIAEQSGMSTLRETSQGEGINATRPSTNSEWNNASETDKVLLVVLCFFLPPLAVYLYEGSWTKRCTVNLILTLLCGLPGLIHALVVILGDK